MSEQDDRRLAGRARWSHAARCPRMAGLALLGTEPEPLTDRQHGRLQRGKDAQRYFGQRLAERFGEDDIIREKAVPWPAPPALPIGELHTDFFIKSEKLVMECKSSEAVDSMFDLSVKQVKGQVHFDPEAESGALVFLDRDYQVSDMFPILVTEEDAAELEAEVATIVHTGQTGELPPRTCLHPGEGIGKFCPFIGECFKDWTPPAATDGTEIAPLATEFYLAKRELEEKKGELAPAEERVAAAKEALLAADPPAGDTVCGPLTLKRIDVRGSQTFSLSKARKAGVWIGLHDELFQAFVSQNEGHTRFTVTRTENGDLVHEDYGDEPPF